jgi:hypothetical protein
LPLLRIPTARLPEHGLRDSEDHVYPPVAGPAKWVEERPATDKRQSSVYGAGKCSLQTALLPFHG